LRGAETADSRRFVDFWGCIAIVRPYHAPRTSRQERATPEGGDLRQARDIDAARRVLRTEIAGLDALATALDGSFAAAIDLLAEVRGRVTVTGMGKSGHVARKIAATFSSTGTPAQFVHPGEASHGDLGMIAENDAVLALSNSGDTAELAAIVAYTRRFHPAMIELKGLPATLDEILEAYEAPLMARLRERRPPLPGPGSSTRPARSPGRFWPARRRPWPTPGSSPFPTR
jgi:hypothetical protein